MFGPFEWRWWNMLQWFVCNKLGYDCFTMWKIFYLYVIVEHIDMYELSMKNLLNFLDLCDDDYQEIVRRMAKSAIFFDRRVTLLIKKEWLFWKVWDINWQHRTETRETGKKMLRGCEYPPRENVRRNGRPRKTGGDLVKLKI